MDETLGGAAAHRALVQSVAFSPDGTKLASGGFRQVKIWRRDDAPPRTRKADAALGSVVSAISEDGKKVVCADAKGTLHVLDAESGKSLGTVPGPGKAAPVLLGLSPDATRAAVYSADGSLALFSLAEGKRLGGKEALPGVRTLTWTRDGRAVLTAGDDKVVRLWPLPSGDKAELVASKEFPGATGPIIALDCTAGPDLLITAAADGNVRLWNLAEVKLTREQALPGVVAVRLSGDGKQFAAGRADGSVQVWDLAMGKAIADLSGDAETEARLAALDWAASAGALEAAFQAQEAARIEAESKGLDDLLKKAGENIAALRKELAEAQKASKAAGDAKEAAQKLLDAAADRVAKAPGGQPDAALQAQHKAAADGLAAATTAEAAATSAARASEIHLKDAEAEAESYTATRARNSAAVAAANAAGTKAKEAQAKATADSATIRQAAAARGLRPLAVRFSADSAFVAAVYGDGSSRAWAVASARPVASLPGGPATASASIAAEPDGAFSACLADGSTARLATSPRWGLLRTIGDDSAASPFSDRVNAVRFSPDGQTLAAGGGEPTRSGDISLWDVSGGRLIKEWKERHSDAVLSLDFSADGKSLASGGADRLARVTEIATGKVTRLFEGHTHHVLGVSFRADGRVLATAGADGVVTAWDMISGERKKKVEGWSKEVTAVQFIGATNQMVTSSADNLIRIVDDNGSEIRVVARVPDFLQTAGAAATARLVLGGGEDGVLRVWDGTTGQSLAAFGVEPEAGTPTAAPGGGAR